MKTFTPSKRVAPTAPVAQSNNNSTVSLVGMTASQVSEACQWKITAGRGTDRMATGETFLNLLTPRLFVEGEGSMHAIPQVYANFDNLEDSIAVNLASHMSKELLETGDITEYQYFFKLINAKTLVTIATDMPERITTEDEESSDLPAFLTPDASAKPVRVAPTDVCAYLHIYIEQNGSPKRIASRDIEARYAPQVAVVDKLVAKGLHIQAGVVPQTKVMNWLASQDVPAESTESANNFDMNEFTEANTEA